MTCPICEQLKKRLQGHRITRDVYRAEMVRHNTEELEKLKQKMQGFGEEIPQFLKPNVYKV